jgi:hypothetical protein
MKCDGPASLFSAKFNDLLRVLLGNKALLNLQNADNFVLGDKKRQKSAEREFIDNTFYPQVTCYKEKLQISVV